MNLNKIITKLSSLTNDNYTTEYDLKKIPPISLNDYLHRIIHYSKCSFGAIIHSIIYIDRLRKKIPLNNYNIHIIIITCMLIACKYYDDINYNNNFFASVGGVTITEMNFFELSFLNHLDYKLFVTKKLFKQYLTELF